MDAPIDGVWSLVSDITLIGELPDTSVETHRVFTKPSANMAVMETEANTEAKTNTVGSKVNSRSVRRSAAMLLAFGLLMAACGNESTDATTTTDDTSQTVTTEAASENADVVADPATEETEPTPVEGEGPPPGEDGEDQGPPPGGEGEDGERPGPPPGEDGEGQGPPPGGEGENG